MLTLYFIVILCNPCTKKEDTMHKEYCKRCHQPVHGYMNLCPLGDYNDGQDGYMPDKPIWVTEDEEVEE